MYNEKVEIEIAIQFLILARDRCHTLRDLADIPLSNELFSRISEIHKELSDQKKLMEKRGKRKSGS